MIRAIASLCLAMAVVAATASCRVPIEMPVDIEGHYVTDHPKYSDKAFTLTPDMFELDLGEHGSQSYFIDAVYEESNGDDQSGRRFVVIYLNDEGQEYKLDFVCYTDEAGDVERIVFKNQPHVHWAKAGS